MDLKTGDKVHYVPYKECKVEDMENGIVKRLSDGGDGAFVVYNCNGEWDRLDDYTAANTPFTSLAKGWIKGAKNSQFCTIGEKRKMKYLRITNAGNIEVEALTLLGASTKRGNSAKVGQFGSGNKFAIPYFLRNNIPIHIFSNGKEIMIRTTRKQFREMDFDVVVIDGKETSFTTDTGHKWNCWQALRELYCNAIDEGEYGIDVVEEIQAEENGNTEFYIGYVQEVQDFYENFNDYFAEGKEVLSENEHGRILKKHGVKTCIYRRGILCYETELKSLFDYDFKDLELTEDRLAKYYWEVNAKVWKLMFTCKNKYVVRKLLADVNSGDIFEKRFDNYGLSGLTVSEEFKTVIAEQETFTADLGGYLTEDEKVSTRFLPSDIYNHVRNTCKDVIKIPRSVSGEVGGVLYVFKELSQIQQDTVRINGDFLKECHFTMPYEIKMAVFTNKNILGTIDKDAELIIVSEVAFDEGVHKVLNVVMEEYCHLKYGVADETRPMQDALLDMMLTQMKKQSGFNL